MNKVIQNLFFVAVWALLVTSVCAPASLANLIYNGDFELGNTGFTTGYTYVHVQLPAHHLGGDGTYTIHTDPVNAYPLFTSYGDHTTGSGNMLIFNADALTPLPDKRVWEQTVSVTPDTDYVFVYWLSNCHPKAPAQLQCSINGTAIGTASAPSGSGVWYEVSYSWNSGDSATATISLMDLRRAWDGDDFAIDDISFSAPTLVVDIDIKPGSHPNVINLDSYGVIPVAILSGDNFDATMVAPDTVVLAGAGVEVRGKNDKYMAHEEDVNDDGLVDLVLHVATENLDPETFQDGYAVLTGSTRDGQSIEGSDEITIEPAP
jgi:hypothetical protein